MTDTNTETGFSVETIKRFVDAGYSIEFIDGMYVVKYCGAFLKADTPTNTFQMLIEWALGLSDEERTGIITNKKAG